MKADEDSAMLTMQNISSVAEETAASAEEATASSDMQYASMQSLSLQAENLDRDAKLLQVTISRFTV
jgi:methyl-accepting chemotaxis protein